MLQSLVNYNFFLCKLECFIGISTNEKKPYHPTCICDSQLAADTPLALFSAMNELQRVLFLKSELGRLPLVSKMFIE